MLCLSRGAGLRCPLLPLRKSGSQGPVMLAAGEGVYALVATQAPCLGPHDNWRSATESNRVRRVCNPAAFHLLSRTELETSRERTPASGDFRRSEPQPVGRTLSQRTSRFAGRGVGFRSHADRVWSPAGQPWLTPKLAPHPGLEPGTTSLTGSFPYRWGPCGMEHPEGIEPSSLRWKRRAIPKSRRMQNWCPRGESNRLRAGLQPTALPMSYSGKWTV